MKSNQLRMIMAVAAAFLLLAAVSAPAANLSLQTTSDGNTQAGTFPVGSPIFLNVLVDDPTGIAGVAFTVTFDAAFVTPPAVNAEGLPVNASDITSIFPFTYSGTTPATDTFRTNLGTGKIYLSGAAINETTGGAKYTAGASTVLFTIKFMVKSAAAIGAFNFGLEQTQLFNPAAGYGTDANSNGVYDAGTDTMAPVTVLVGAVDKNNVDFSDLTKAFPVITSAFTGVPLAVNTSTGWTIGGTAAYTGPQIGTLNVAAFAPTDTTLATPIGGVQIPWPAGSASKAFTVAVPNDSYKLGAYIDSNGNDNRDAAEAWGQYTTTIVINGGNDGTLRDFSLSDPDDNGDGIADYWAALYPTIGSAGDDSDQDGYTNLQEFLNGTDPTVQNPPNGNGYNPATDSRVGTWSATLTATGQDLGGVSVYTVTIGTSASASTLAAAPAPPSYSVKMELYDLDWAGPFSNSIRQNGAQSYKWLLAVNPHGNIAPPTERSSTVTWDPEDFSPVGSYRLREGYDGTGAVVVSDMRTTTSYTVTGADADKYFTIEFSFSETVNLDLLAGWNLISLPVTPDDAARSAIFPDAEAVYMFNQAYQAVLATDTMAPGIGYWVKVPSTATYQVTGQAYSGYTKTLTAGWHLLGGVNGSNITPTTNPSDQISVMYGFSNSYSVASSLTAGGGYWVKILSDCDFTIGN